MKTLHECVNSLHLASMARIWPSAALIFVLIIYGATGARVLVDNELGPPGDPTTYEDFVKLILPTENVLRVPSRPNSSLQDSRSSSAATLDFELLFRTSVLTNSGFSVRLPPAPRTLTLEVFGSSSDVPACQLTLPYQEQNVSCPNLVEGDLYRLLVVDSDDEALQLTSLTFNASNNLVLPVVIELGMLVLEASFDSLAWGGMYSSRMQEQFGSSPVPIHAQIVGAMVSLFSRTSPDLPWDTQWTGDEGTAAFFIIPGSHSFVANMSVGDDVLRTAPIEWHTDLPLQQAQLVPLQADPELLCTGEVEQVRSAEGTFPRNLSMGQYGRQLVYHPKGFFCRWELVPDNPQLHLAVNYAYLLPDESITLYLAPNNVIRLELPADPGSSGVFETSVWVDRSVFVEFQTTRSSTYEVGDFSIQFSSSGRSSSNDNHTMVAVLASVSAAGAVAAAFCFLCVCCSRRRRTAVVVDANAAGSAQSQLRLLRVPSAVRELLPSKPYLPPSPNPLPGADSEPDCCSICLVELEAGELLTVLPCMHFYHQACIDSWLKRNCSCPLCKSNVLEAFKHIQSNPLLQQRQQHHHQRRSHSNAWHVGQQQQQQQLVAVEHAAQHSNNSSSSSSDRSFGEASSHAAVSAAGSEVHVLLGNAAAGAAQAASAANVADTEEHADACCPHSRGWPAATGPSAAAAAAAAGLGGDLRPPGLVAVDSSLQPPGCAQLNQDDLAAAPTGQHGIAAGPSPSAAVATEAQPRVMHHSAATAAAQLQSGTVFATATDFAAAAAAAAGGRSDGAPVAAGASPESLEAGSQLQELATGGDPAPVAARAGGSSSSSSWSMRLQQLLTRFSATAASVGPSATTDAAAAAAAAPGSSDLPPAVAVAAASAEDPVDGRQLPGRVAVSLYVYADAHPTIELSTVQHESDTELQQHQQQPQHEQQQQRQRQWQQQQQQQASMTVIGLPPST